MAHQPIISSQSPLPADETAGVIAPPPLLYFGTLMLGLWLDQKLPFGRTPRTSRRIIGAILCTCALAFGGSAVRALRRAKTNVSPYRASSIIVRKGPYRFSRNPIYLAFTGVYVGLAFLLEARWPFLLLTPLLGAIEAGVIRREENYLRRRFGASYRRYSSHVRRWI